MTPELFRALGALVEEPGPSTEALAGALGLPAAPDRDEHTDLFLFQLYPYASVYVGAEGMLGGEARVRIGGFWRAVGREAPVEPDHLGALLGLYAALGEEENDEVDPARQELRRRARAALLWEHLLSWLPPFLMRVRELGSPAYRAWARILSDALTEEARTLSAPGAPVHLTEAPEPFEPDPDAEAQGEAFLAAVLTPVRSGFVLARDDLERCARVAGLGLRRGERRWVLGALLSQDAPATLAWLAAEAGRQAEALSALPPALDPVAAFWSARARTSAERLAALANEAREASLL